MKLSRLKNRKNRKLPIAPTHIRSTMKSFNNEDPNSRTHSLNSSSNRKNFRRELQRTKQLMDTIGLEFRGREKREWSDSLDFTCSLAFSDWHGQLRDPDTGDEEDPLNFARSLAFSDWRGSRSNEESQRDFHEESLLISHSISAVRLNNSRVRTTGNGLFIFHTISRDRARREYVK